MRIDVETNEEQGSGLGLGLRLSNDRIPVHLGDVLLGYARFRLDGHLQMINAPDDEERARSQAALANRGWIEEKAEAPAAGLDASSQPSGLGRLPTPPFGGRPAYQRIFDALRNVDLDGPVRLEFAVANGLESVVVGVMQALFGDHTDTADQRYPRIELPWPTSAEQFEELLMRIPLWSIAAHLVRDRDTEVQCREYQGMMFLADDKVPPLLDHLDRTLRDSRELWRVCVDQEKMLARIGEALDDAHPVAAIRVVRAVLEAGRG